jgi:hypothetical protein
LGAVVRPFVTVLVPAVLTLAVGTLLFRAVSGDERVFVALVGVSVVIIVVNLMLLRLLAGRILRNALEVLPIPERYSRRAARILKLHPLDAS